MVVGHAAMAVLGRAARPDLPFWYLLLASYAPDLVDFVLWISPRAIDQLPNSHSFPSAAATIVVMALIGGVVLRRGAAGALVGSLLVVSHILADYITGHAKPTWPGGPKVGLQLYDYPAANFALEMGCFAVAWYLYRQVVPGGRWARLSTAAALLAAGLVQVGTSYYLHVMGSDRVPRVLHAIMHYVPKEPPPSRP
jgi:hypothetical protein